MYEASKLRLYPTTEPQQRIVQFIGAARFVYNRYLYMRQKIYTNKGKSVSAYAFNKYIAQLKRLPGYEWLKGIHSQVLQSSVLNADRAYKNFFKGLASFPRYKKKDAPYQSFQFPQGVKLDTKKRKVYLPKIGWVNVRGIRDDYDYTNIKTVTVSVESNGNYYCSILLDTPKTYEPINNGETVGIDLGVVTTLTLSNGKKYSMPEKLKKLEAKRRRLARQLSRKEKGSKNRVKARKQLARAYLKERNLRLDFLHKASKDLSENQAVVIEDLHVKNMTKSAKGTRQNPGKNVSQKRGLNRSILAQGWSMFVTMLEYKLARNGNTLIKVPAQHTSQTCSKCGCVNKRNRRTQASFKCIACGHTDNADVNAAKNILARGLSSLSTAGTAGSYACGDPSDGATHCAASYGSLKQEAMSKLL